MNQNLSSYWIFIRLPMPEIFPRQPNELYISQPAISKSIQKLEENLGCKLFSRSSRGVVLTDEGQLLYGHVKEAFETLTLGEDKLKALHRSWCRSPADRCQFHTLQICTSALSERIHTAESAYQYFHQLSVDQRNA